MQCPPEYFDIGRQGETNPMDKIDARQLRSLRDHVDAVVGPYADLAVLPVDHVFMNQFILWLCDRHSPDESWGAIGLAGLEAAIGHHLP